MADGRRRVRSLEFQRESAAEQESTSYMYEGDEGQTSPHKSPPSSQGKSTTSGSRINLVKRFSTNSLDLEDELGDKEQWHLAEEEAKLYEPYLQGYGDHAENYHDDQENEDCYADLINSRCPVYARAFVLFLAFPLMLASLVASKLSLFALGHSYHRLDHLDETEKEEHRCEIRFASFWAVFTPVLAQFILIGLSFASTQKYDLPRQESRREKLDRQIRENRERRRQRGMRVSGRGIGHTSTFGSIDEENKSLGSVNESRHYAASPRADPIQSPTSASSTSSQSVQSFDENMHLPSGSSGASVALTQATDNNNFTTPELRPSKDNSKLTKYFWLPLGVLFDPILSAVGTMYLVFSIIPSQDWYATSAQMMALPALWNGLGFLHRAFLSESNKRYRTGMRKARLIGDLVAFLIQGTLIVGVALKATDDHAASLSGIAVPFTLFGGLTILRTRLSDDRSPMNVPNIFNDEPAQRLKYAFIRLFVETLTIAMIGTFLWSTDTGFFPSSTECSKSYGFLWRYNSLLSNKYLRLALAHVASSFLAVMLAKLVCSMRMNLMGLALPLSLFWPLFFSIATSLFDKLPRPFVWGDDNSELIENNWLSAIIVVGVLAQFWSCRHLWYEMDTSLSYESSVWYLPFFNVTVLDQYLLLNRGEKAPHWRKTTKRQPKPIENDARPQEGADVEGDQDTVVSDGDQSMVTSAADVSVAQSADETQDLILKMSQELDSPAPMLTEKRQQHHIVLATCMWHEDPKEMRQWVSSLGHVVHNVVETAKNCFISPTGVYSRDTYEAHVVVDSAFERPKDFTDAQVTPSSDIRRPNIYTSTLLKILEEELGAAIPYIDLTDHLFSHQIVTEYGVVIKVNLIPPDAENEIRYRVRRDFCNYYGINSNLELTEQQQNTFDRVLEYFNVGFFLYIHLKDPILCYNGKRNNQVLYMNFILGEVERRKREARKKKRAFDVPSMKHTLLVTTDGDTSFEFKDVDALVDSLVRDEESAGACGRIRPLGSGMMAWYQQFEYASGHWFQKTAEHVLGTVQCCPGCFSIWRMSRLNEILYEYSQPSEDGQEYLRKDQGEDRWMCTLLIQHGWKMSYCAAAVAYTFAPEGFSVFFDQRRRWLSSTMANMYDLILTGSKVANNHGRSGLPLIYRMYIFMMFLLGIFTPATIVIFVAGGIELATNKGAGLGFFVSILIPLLFVALILWQEYRKSHGSPFRNCCGRANDSGDTERSLLPETSETALTAKFKKQQISLAFWLSIVYGFLLILVLVSLIVKAFKEFYSAETFFLLSLIGLFVSTMILHPRDIPGAFNGFIYFLFIPMAYLILYMYAFANMNVMSWGTRSEDAESNEGSEAEFYIVEDPIATDVSIRRRNNGNQNTDALAASLELYFEVPVELSSEREHARIKDKLKVLAEETSREFKDQSVSPGSSCMNLEASHDGYCVIFTGDGVCLSTISQWLTYWRNVDGMEKVWIFCDSYHPLLLNLARRRSLNLERLSRYGTHILQYVVRKEVPRFYRLPKTTESFFTTNQLRGGTRRTDTGPRDEQSRKGNLQKELDSLRTKVCQIILLLNLFWPVVVVSMSLSPQLYVFQSNFAGLSFLIFCGIVLAIQFLCMLVHRWETFMTLVSLPFAFERSFHSGVMNMCSALGKRKYTANLSEREHFPRSDATETTPCMPKICSRCYPHRREQLESTERETNGIGYEERQELNGRSAEPPQGESSGIGAAQGKKTHGMCPCFQRCRKRNEPVYDDQPSPAQYQSGGSAVFPQNFYQERYSDALTPETYQEVGQNADTLVPHAYQKQGALHPTDPSQHRAHGQYAEHQEPQLSNSLNSVPSGLRRSHQQVIQSGSSSEGIKESTSLSQQQATRHHPQQVNGVSIRPAEEVEGRNMHHHQGTPHRSQQTNGATMRPTETRNSSGQQIVSGPGRNPPSNQRGAFTPRIAPPVSQQRASAANSRSGSGYQAPPLRPRVVRTPSTQPHANRGRRLPMGRGTQRR
eukprot:gb/GECG01013488.1/.p1 GENE.gb/GECG01013488.1/~~gb/GECG01013488.1/.p1  ORF type:complete len:1984 (+),score=177.40 gb/GECG01013488.1/:1-5952(+)